ncbi:GIY-YIG nuclease family protein [Roseibium sp. FZY0029]|uniref:GIY-YIG nuclease family protein n=1 Tax=Roseibium sp. FZY0029 TaxID=3116647 RepID=UPI002EAF11D1|nr:GIY-YIG nuclease family protein [Roseibium sp. FZY0029]
MRSHFYFTYILASGPGGTLYVGVTNDLVRRTMQHREGVASNFTRKYKVHRLVYFEANTDVEIAIRREKNLKKWNRAWKIQLISKLNPDWHDLLLGLLTAENQN